MLEISSREARLAQRVVRIAGIGGTAVVGIAKDNAADSV